MKAKSADSAHEWQAQFLKGACADLRRQAFSGRHGLADRNVREDRNGAVGRSDLMDPRSGRQNQNGEADPSARRNPNGHPISGDAAGRSVEGIPHGHRRSHGVWGRSDPVDPSDVEVVPNVREIRPDLHRSHGVAVQTCPTDRSGAADRNARKIRRGHQTIHDVVDLNVDEVRELQWARDVEGRSGRGPWAWCQCLSKGGGRADDGAGPRLHHPSPLSWRQAFCAACRRSRVCPWCQLQ